MAFHDIRLPEDVEKGAQGGPRFKTTIMILGGGFEKRNIEWEKVKGAWDVGYGIDSKDAFSGALDFFYARNGMGHSFRFKDWMDYQVGLPGSPVVFAVGDSTTKIFQLEKRYTSGAYSFDRELSKIVDGTVEIYVNSILQASGWTLDLLTGLLTFTTAPGVFDIALVCEFDVPVRFDTDSLDITAETFDAGAIPQLPVVEVKGE